MLQAPVIAEQNRDYIPGQLSSNVKYMRYSMAEASGTTLTDRTGNYPDMTTSGSGIWTNLPGWLRPEHNVTQAKLTQAQIADIMRIDDIPNGCLLVGCLAYISANPAGNAQFFDYGDSNEGAGLGGFGFYRQSGSTSVRFNYVSEGGTGRLGVSGLNMGNGRLTSIIMVLDRANNTINAYKDGKIWASIDGGSGFPGTDYVGSRSEGLALMSKTSNSAWLGNMGAGEHSGMKDFMALKFTNHPGSTVISQIISDHYNLPFEHSKALIGQ